MRIFFLLGSSGVVIAVGLACNSPTGTPSACTVNSNATAAVVTMVWRARPDSMRVLVQGAATIRAACAYVDTQSGPHIMVGRIVRGAGVDPRVPFHYLPDSIALVDAAIELCDSGLLRTPADVDAYFLGSTGRADAPSAPYCLWGAPPVLVEPPAWRVASAHPPYFSAHEQSGT